MRTGSYVRHLHGLILHRTSVREKDRVVEAYTREEGKVRAFAPGVRHVASRRAGHLEPLMETRLTLAQSSRGDAVREARVLHTFHGIREDGEKMDAAYAIARLLRDTMSDGVADSVLYDVLIRLFSELDRVERPSPLLVPTAFVHVLRSLGILPDLHRCSHCRQRLRVGHFSFLNAKQGLWCDSCHPLQGDDMTNVVKILRLLLTSPIRAQSLAIEQADSRQLIQLLQKLAQTQPLDMTLSSSRRRHR